MSNYITIETGYYKPFKENETDPELKIWADKYFEIIKKIHEVLSPYNNRFKHFVELDERIKLEEQIIRFSERIKYLPKKDKDNKTRELLLQSSFKDEMNSLFEDNDIGFFNSLIHNNEDKSQDLLWRFQHLSDFIMCPPRSGVLSLIEDELLELKEELRKCLLHRVWKSDDSVLINESNIVSVAFDDNNGNLLFTTSSLWKINVYPFANPVVHYYGHTRYEMRDNIDGDTLKMTYSLIDDIKTTGTSPLSEGFLLDFKCGLAPMFAEIVSRCSIVETWKDFQSGNIDKIKKDKIRCRQFDFDNANVGIRVYT